MDRIEIGNAVLRLGVMEKVLRELPDNSVDAVVTDPPYGLKFMGKKWDYGAPTVEQWEECFRVLKPGGHLLSFAGTRTQHRMAVNIEDAGFEIRDMIAWVYGCLDERTEVATKDGVKPYHKTMVGDLVLCYDVTTGSYSYQPILEVVEYDYEDTAYRLIGDFGEQVVSRNHRCIVERDGKEVFVLAEDAEREQQARVPVLESLPELHDALSDAHQRAGRSQQDLQRGVQTGADRQGEQGASSVGGAQGALGCVCSVREGRVETGGMVEENRSADMQQSMQWAFARGGVGEAQLQGTRGMGTRAGGSIAAAHDGAGQPFMEGRADLPQAEGCVCGSEDQVRSLPGSVRVDGAQGRVCDGASAGGCAGYWSSADADGVRASHQPRCDGQSAGEPDPVQDERGAQEVRAWRGHQTAVVRIEPFRYVGKVWCLRVPTGSFVAVRDGVAFPTGNSGFPKSMDVSKAIDKAAGAEREVVGRVSGMGKQNPEWNGTSQGRAENSFKPEYDATAPATDDARQWQGWGTALKPALEPVTVARKPLSGTVAANVLEYGTGAINIDGCRVGDNPGYKYAADRNGTTFHGEQGSRIKQTAEKKGVEFIESTNGRWPANLIHDGSEEVRSAFPMAGGQQCRARTDGAEQFNGVYGALKHVTNRPEPRVDVDKIAARFFYCAKASKSERNQGIPDGLTNKHPTVKPVALMRYLVRLVTPPNGLILDPFMGSGTTGIAALQERFRFFGIEMDEDSFAYAKCRINSAMEVIDSAKQPMQNELLFD